MNVSVVVTGCRILKFLARNAVNQVAIAEQGGIKVILEALGAHQGDEEVQKEGCWSLKNLACNAANKVSIVE